MPSETEGSKPTFSHLADAVQFIATAVEGRHWTALADACQEPPEEWELEDLRKTNAHTPLVGLYRGREFPPEAQEFKLGGHAKELGHIHIDFVSAEAGWQIESIFMCR